MQDKITKKYHCSKFVALFFILPGHRFKIVAQPVALGQSYLGAQAAVAQTPRASVEGAVSKAQNEQTVIAGLTRNPLIIKLGFSGDSESSAE